MNLLFLFPDQHRPDWLGRTPGLPLRTPHLDALRSRGMQFTRALCPSPLCAPSRACLATGREYRSCGVRNNRDDLPAGSITFYQLLRDAGYHVAGCGKFDLHKGSYIWGRDGRTRLDAWGFSDGIDNEGKIDAVLSGRDAPAGPYMAFLEQQGLREMHVRDIDQRRREMMSTFPTPLPESAYCDNWIGGNALTLLRRCPPGKPWFLQVNFTGPHLPWDITETMSRWYEGTRFPPPVNPDARPAHQHNAVRCNYAAMIENIDGWVGRLLEEVAVRGESNDTLVVYSSDHGEMLGDHGKWGKVVPYQASLGVPLVIAGPGVRPGARCDAPATILDLGATFLDYAGARALPNAESRTLRPLLEGRLSMTRSHVTAALEDWSAVFDGRYKLIEGFGGAPLLFDLHDDPQETRNRHPDLIEEGRRLRLLLNRSPYPTP